MLHVDAGARASFDLYSSLWEALAGALHGRAVALTRTERNPVEDANWRGVTFTSRSDGADGAVTLVESLLNGGGDPREGYGYDYRAELSAHIADREIRVVGMGGGWEPCPSTVTIVLTGATSPEVLTFVETLRVTMGESDQSYRPVWALSIAKALEAGGLADAAERVARDALARSPSGEAVRDDLLEWLERRARTRS
ncbi:MAG: hypothetical protein WCJ30_05410 [Deltaproteobacteria bacterium]